MTEEEARALLDCHLMDHHGEPVPLLKAVRLMIEEARENNQFTPPHLGHFVIITPQSWAALRPAFKALQPEAEKNGAYMIHGCRLVINPAAAHPLDRHIEVTLNADKASLGVKQISISDKTSEMFSDFAETVLATKNICKLQGTECRNLVMSRSAWVIIWFASRLLPQRIDVDLDEKKWDKPLFLFGLRVVIDDSLGDNEWKITGGEANANGNTATRFGQEMP